MLGGMSSHHVIRSQYSKVLADMSKIPVDYSLQQKDAEAGELFVNQGITSTVYNDDAGIKRIAHNPYVGRMGPY